MSLIVVHRALFTGGLVLLGVGLERLLNTYMLHSADPPVSPRLVIGLVLIGAGGLLVALVVIAGSRRRGLEDFKNPAARS